MTARAPEEWGRRKDCRTRRRTAPSRIARTCSGGALTNAFSKKWQNLTAAYALWFAYYNFCRIHKALRVPPAMEAGIADHAWTIRELLALSVKLTGPEFRAAGRRNFLE